MPRYRTLTFDSARWHDFAFREGDIVISTPPKSGTTWMQMICALLVFRTADLPDDLDTLSPWLDTVTRPLDAVAADLEAQRHRRFIKTHTPLDGLPFDERVTYLCVGRDPRDVGVSFGNHMANFDMIAFLRARKAAVGLADVDELLGDGAVPRSELDRFLHWAYDDTPVTRGGFSLRYTLHHLRTCWDARAAGNVVLLHYDELLRDLASGMRRCADVLGVAAPEPDLVEAATFGAMRARAASLVPESGRSIWLDDKRFFRRGASGQWKSLLRDDDVACYARRVAELAPDDLVRWVHNGPVISGS